MIICYLLLPRRKKTVLLSLSKPQGDKWWRLCVRYSGQNGPQHTVYTLLHFGAFITSEIRGFCVFKDIFSLWSKTLICFNYFTVPILKEKNTDFSFFQFAHKKCIFYLYLSLSLFSYKKFFLCFSRSLYFSLWPFYKGFAWRSQG